MQEFRYKSFKKNLILFLLPLLVPLIGLGLFSQFITRQYLEKEITKNNINLIEQAKENIELIFNEIDAINLNLSTNMEITVELKRILSRANPIISYEENKTLNTINNFISASANAHPYIHSIYVYFDNPSQRFLTSTDGVVSLDYYYDTTWFNRNYNHISKYHIWAESRIIKNYKFSSDGIEVISVFRSLSFPGYKQPSGIIVLNIYSEYFKDHTNNLAIYPGQKIMVLNDKNEIIFSNSPVKMFSELSQRLNSEQSVFEVDYLGTKYVTIQLASDKYGWKFISLIPHGTFYKMPFEIRKMTAFFVLISFPIGLTLTYWLTKRNDIRLQKIVEIIQSAERGAMIVEEPAFNSKDEYGYITYNIIKTFIEQKYLQIQLSERKYKLRYMELQALQSQINPHFLFNTFETIKWKVIGFTQQPNEASQMIVQLSDILKYSMDPPDSKVSLQQELFHTRNYIEIQKVRYIDKFDVIWEYDEPVLKFSVMRLIIQPLIENAIYHGIKPLNRKSLIKIKIRHIKGELLITVINNGLGIPKDKLIQLRERLARDGEYTQHIGLYNTNKRLKLGYGDDYGLEIRSKENCGTVVYIRIPAILHESD